MENLSYFNNYLNELTASLNQINVISYCNNQR